MLNSKTDRVLFLPREFFKIFLPLFVQQIMQAILGSMDVLILSHRSDTLVAAAGLSNQLLVAGSMFLGIVEIGMTVLLTQLSGAEEKERIKRVIQNGILLAVGVALFLNAVIFLAGPQLISFMQAGEEIQEPALTYLRIVGFSLIFQALLGSLGAAFRSFSFLKEIVWVSLLVNILNIIGNSLVILTPFPYLGEEIAGVANATLLARVVGALCLIVLLPRRFSDLNWDLASWLPKPNRKTIGKLLSLGVPAGMESVSYNISQTILTGILAFLGTAVLSSKIYTETLTSYVYTVSATAAMTGQIMVGRMIGKGEKEEAAKEGENILRVSTVFVAFIMLLIALASFYWARLLSNTEEVAILTITLSFWSVLLEPLRCWNSVLVSQLNAAGDVRYPVITGVITNYILLLPLSYLLAIPCGFGIVGIWLARIADEGIRSVFFYLRWRSGKWKEIELFK